MPIGSSDAGRGKLDMIDFKNPNGSLYALACRHLDAIGEDVDIANKLCEASARQEALLIFERNRAQAETVRLREIMRRALKFCDCAAGEGFEMMHSDGEVLDAADICTDAAKALGVKLGSEEYFMALTP